MELDICTPLVYFNHTVQKERNESEKVKKADKLHICFMSLLKYC